MDKLTPRQRAFAASYAQHGIAERAALDAGYSPRTARGGAGRLLANVGIRAELDRLAAATDDANIADLRELRTTWTGAMRAEDVAWKERLRASELLGKSLGAFAPDKIEHSGPGGTPLAGPVINLTLTTREKSYPDLYGPKGRLTRRTDPAIDHKES